MASLVLIPWAETCWSAEGRVVSGTPLPLTPAGISQAQSWGKALVGLDRLVCSDERASVETATLVAGETRARRKQLPELAEVDVGLWDGLTIDELKRRYPKIFKRWYDDPTSVRPPEGEDLLEASHRLRAAIEQVTRKMGKSDTGVVLGPLAFGVVRCIVESRGIHEVRSMMHDAPLRYPRVGESAAKALKLEFGSAARPAASPRERQSNG